MTDNLVQKLREISRIKKTFPMQGDDLEGEAADEIVRLNKNIETLINLFHEAISLPQGMVHRQSTAGEGFYNPLHHSLKGNE